MLWEAWGLGVQGVESRVGEVPPLHAQAPVLLVTYAKVKFASIETQHPKALGASEGFVRRTYYGWRHPAPPYMPCTLGGTTIYWRS